MKTKRTPVQRLEATLKRMHYAPSTIKIYTTRFWRFVQEIDKHPDRASKQDVIQYLNEKKLSYTQLNQSINAIKFYYEKVLGQKRKLYKLKHPKKKKRLPRVIDQEKILTSLARIKDIRARTILELTYTAGLRVSEVARLKVEHIDSDRMLLLISDSKGNKDRYVPLSETMLHKLRAYYKHYKPNEYLFEGKNGGYISPATIQRYFKKYIDSDKSVHVLRHSCATHLIEAGTDSKMVQKLLGHKNIRTTEIYMHVSNKSLQKLPLPI